MTELKYSKAIERLDEIIAKIESNDIDVDELSLRLKEAVNLVKQCKAKIDKAEMEVKQVVDDLASLPCHSRESPSGDRRGNP